MRKTIEVKKADKQKNTKAVTTPWSKAWIWYLIIPAITFLVYHSVSSFDSTNWDDKAYIKETPIVRSLSSDNIKAIFTTKVLNSYNPIVLLTFALDYKFAKLSPGWCHAINLFFHLLNGLLVFACMRKLRFKAVHAGLIAILFSIHPLATEAVAWIAGRKDVVYLFFFLLSWKFYLDFFHVKKKVFFILSIFFFLLSLLSKVQAITLPFVLIASDILLHVKFEKKAVLNKIPFLLLALTFGLIAIAGSGELVADKYSTPLSFLDKIFYSIIAFGLYFIKIIFPIGQNAIYQFPESGSFTYTFYIIIGIISIVILTGAFFYSIKRNPRLSGSILFFVVCIFPVLHVVAVNSAIIYERFIYLADIGIFMAVFSLIEKFPKQEIKLSYLLAGVCLLFSGLSYARIPIWKNSFSLWSDVIKKDPTAADAYTNRGQYYEQQGEFDKAFLDYSETIKLQPKKPSGYHNRAVSYFRLNDFKHALEDNRKVLDIDPQHTDALVNRAAIFFNMDQMDSTIYYYKKALEVTPRLAKGYYECGLAYLKMKDFVNASEYFKKAIEIIPDYADAYTYLAVAKINLNLIDEALFSINASEKIVSNSAARTLVSNELLRFGNEKYALGKTDEALDKYFEAAKVMPSNPETYFNIGGIYLMKRNIKQARENWQKAISLDPNHVGSKEWLARTVNSK